MKNPKTKENKKSRFSAKTRLISMILAIITALSMLTVSVTAASAAETKPLGDISIDTNELLDGITTSVIKKGIEIATTGNPGASILGAGVSSVLGTVFDSVIGGSSGTDKVLKAIDELSDRIQKNHNEEMEALSNIKAKLDKISYKQDMQYFNSDYIDMTAMYTTVFDLLSYSGADLSTVDDTGKIDKSTYDIYTFILNKTGFNTSTDIDLLFNKMYRYLDADNSNIYQYMVDNYKIALENDGPADFDSVGDFHSIKANLQQIEADVILYYTAYITLLQINYQCAYYNNSEYDQALMETTKNQIIGVANKMSKIDEAFAAAYESVDSMTTAHITVDGATKYFTFTPIAWITAVTAIKSGRNTEFVLDQDWVASESTGLALNQDYLTKDGFYQLDDKNRVAAGTGALSIYDMNADFTINFGTHKIDASKKFLEFQLLWVNIHKGNLKLVGSSEEAPYNKPVGIECNCEPLLVLDDRNGNTDISATVSGLKFVQTNDAFIYNSFMLEFGSKTRGKYSNMKVNIDDVYLVNNNTCKKTKNPKTINAYYGDVTLSNLLIKDEASAPKEAVNLYNSTLTINDNVEMFDAGNMTNPALYGNGAV